MSITVEDIRFQGLMFKRNLVKVVPYYGFSISSMYLMFMKYLSEFDDVKTPEQFKILMEYKNMFIHDDFSKETVSKTFKMINDLYQIEDNLLLNSIPMIEEIFEKDSKCVFEAMYNLRLPKDKNDKICLISFMLETNYSDIKKSANFITNESLSNLVQKILNVKEDETYLDCFCGFNRTSFNINASKYLGYEINCEASIVSNMIMIMLGYNNFRIENKNFYLNESKEIADKIFSDGPIGLRLNEEDREVLGKECRQNEYYNVKKSLECLKENGIAVITVPSKVLSNELFRKLREDLTATKLKAVIALPPLWSGVSINTNLLVFENNKKDDNIIMINASDDGSLDKINKKNNELNEEVIKKILNSLSGEIIDGFSNTIISKDILDKEDISWQPQLYIKKIEEMNFRASEQVKKELEETYKALIDLIK